MGVAGPDSSTPSRTESRDLAAQLNPNGFDYRTTESVVMNLRRPMSSPKDTRRANRAADGSDRGATRRQRPTSKEHQVEVMMEVDSDGSAPRNAVVSRRPAPSSRSTIQGQLGQLARMRQFGMGASSPPEAQVRKTPQPEQQQPRVRIRDTDFATQAMVKQQALLDKGMADPALEWRGAQNIPAEQAQQLRYEVDRNIGRMIERSTLEAAAQADSRLAASLLLDSGKGSDAGADSWGPIWASESRMPQTERLFKHNGSSNVSSSMPFVVPAHIPLDAETGPAHHSPSASWASLSTRKSRSSSPAGSPTGSWLPDPLMASPPRSDNGSPIPRDSNVSSPYQNAPGGMDGLLQHSAQRKLPKKVCYTVSEDCTEDREMNKKKLWALRSDRPRKTAQRDARHKLKPFHALEDDDRISAASASSARISQARGADEVIDGLPRATSNLNKSDDDDDEDEDDEAELAAFAAAQREIRMRKRHSHASSIGKRALSERSDSDGEDAWALFDDLHKLGSSARRMRRRVRDPRTLLSFQDPPPRIQELEEPDSPERERQPEPLERQPNSFYYSGEASNVVSFADLSPHLTKDQLDDLGLGSESLEVPSKAPTASLPPDEAIFNRKDLYIRHTRRMEQQLGGNTMALQGTRQRSSMPPLSAGLQRQFESFVYQDPHTVLDKGGGIVAADRSRDERLHHLLNSTKGGMKLKQRLRGDGPTMHGLRPEGGSQNFDALRDTSKLSRQHQ